MKKFNLLCFALFIVHGLLPMVYAQDIPVGTWRMHISYNDIRTVSVAAANVYGAAENGIMVFDRSDNSISTITKLDGLSSGNITQIAFDQARGQLLVTYANGDIDLIKDSEITNFNTLKNTTTISGSKRINHISVNGNLAYLATDFGVVVFDLAQLAIKETWRDIGAGGTGIRINQSTFRGDSIFLATEKGVLAGDVNNNLLDYNNWKRYATGVFNGNIQSVTIFNDHVYAAVNGSGIYKRENSVWTLQSYLPGLQYKNLTSGTALLVTAGTSLYQISTADVITPVTSDKIISPTIAFLDESNKLWIGDKNSGLVSNRSGAFQSYVANGPSFSGGLRLKYTNNTMSAVSGGFNSALAPLGKQEYLNHFSEGLWSTEPELLNHDLTGYLSETKRYVSSCGYGLEVIDGSTSIIYDETNSPLENVAAGENVRITAIAQSAAGIWVANAGATKPLHLLKSDNTWESFSFPLVSAARYPTHIIVDYLGNVWMTLNPVNGGGILVFERATNKSIYLDNTQNSGGLPSEFVYSIAMDRDGFVWVGTAAGVAYFPDPARVFSPNINAIKPVFGNSFLLRDEKVTAIEIDGGNRKWIGTENGVWLFNSFGEEQIYNFNSQNSPLLSNKIVDLEINNQSGELFMMSDAGIASFRSDATTGEGAFSEIKIFPNPVTNQFNGHVGISGLVTDAIVKITDVSGKLVWQSSANGGSASWNVRDYNGRRASTGIYLVFCIAQDGTESIVGKIAVVN